jgi:hypothetical protein
MSTPHNLNKYEHAALIALSKLTSPTTADVAWNIQNSNVPRVRTQNRSKANRALLKLILYGYAERDIGDREPGSGIYGRYPFRYNATALGRAIADALIVHYEGPGR